MWNLQQDSREKQTQQKEESGKLSAVTGIWIVIAILYFILLLSGVMGKKLSTLVQEELVVIIMYGGIFQNKMEMIFMKV